MQFVEFGIVRSQVDGVTSTYFHPQITEDCNVPNEATFKKPEVCNECGDKVTRDQNLYIIESVSVVGECALMDIRLHTSHKFRSWTVSLVKKLDYASVLYNQLLGFSKTKQVFVVILFSFVIVDFILFYDLIFLRVRANKRSLIR